MTNRLPSIALYAAMIFIALMLTTPEARAAEAWGGCGAQFATCQNDVTPAGEGTSSGTICTDAFGCLNCTASKDMQSATCSRLYMSSGFCTCTLHTISAGARVRATSRKWRSISESS